MSCTERMRRRCDSAWASIQKRTSDACLFFQAYKEPAKKNLGYFIGGMVQVITMPIYVLTKINDKRVSAVIHHSIVRNAKELLIAGAAVTARPMIELMPYGGAANGVIQVLLWQRATHLVFDNIWNNMQLTFIIEPGDSTLFSDRECAAAPLTHKTTDKDSKFKACGIEEKITASVLGMGYYGTSALGALTISFIPGVGDPLAAGLRALAIGQSLVAYKFSIQKTCPDRRRTADMYAFGTGLPFVLMMQMLNNYSTQLTGEYSGFVNNATYGLIFPFFVLFSLARDRVIPDNDPDFDISSNNRNLVDRVLGDIANALIPRFRKPDFRKWIHGYAKGLLNLFIVRAGLFALTDKEMRSLILVVENGDIASLKPLIHSSPSLVALLYLHCTQIKDWIAYIKEIREKKILLGGVDQMSQRLPDGVRQKVVQDHVGVIVNLLKQEDFGDALAQVESLLDEIYLKESGQKKMEAELKAKAKAARRQNAVFAEIEEVLEKKDGAVVEAPTPRKYDQADLVMAGRFGSRR